jgi:hypothetical protein
METEYDEEIEVTSNEMYQIVCGVMKMNSFIVFDDRNKQASDLRSLAQYLSLLGDIIQVENGRIDNDKYMVAESEIKELVYSANELLKRITNKLTKEECKSHGTDSSTNNPSVFQHVKYGGADVLVEKCYETLYQNKNGLPNISHMFE